MQHHRSHWLQIAAILLLVMTLPACVRSASTAMTPLPSLPPPSPTSSMPTLTASPEIAATEAATLEPIDEPSATEPAASATSAVSATATKAVITPACEGAPPTRLRLDSYAYVNPEPPLPNNLRSEAGEENSLLGTIEPGQAMKILDGPKCADGWFWWKVQTLETDLVGWTAEGDAQNYWLIPCSSESECKAQ